MKTNKKIPKASSTEEKIKEAARKLFTEKGYAAVKTRDIAAEAGINLALLNYYFRNKQKLFEIIMLENLQRVKEGVLVIVNDENTKLEEKIEMIVAHYIDILTENSDLPLFVLSVMRHNPDEFARMMNIENTVRNSLFFKQAGRILRSGKREDVNPLHFLMNLVGLIVFPFAASPMIQKLGKIDRNEFNALMAERRRLIPLWIKGMVKNK